MRFASRFEPQQHGLPVAPMLDVIFLLLVFFVTTSIFAQMERAMNVRIPIASESAVLDRGPGDIIVNVAADGRIIANQSELTLESLGAMLVSIAELFDEPAVIIRGDRDTRLADMMDVLNVCAKAGIGNVSFAAIKGPEGP